MRALASVVLVACSATHEPRDAVPRVVAVESPPSHRDAEIVVGVLPDLGPRIDVAAQLDAQLALRVPDVVVRRGAREGSALDRPFTHAFARVRSQGATIIVDGPARANAVIGTHELRDDAAFAIVRVREGATALEIIGADGVRLH